MKFKVAEKYVDLPVVHIASRYKDTKASYENIQTSITFNWFAKSLINTFFKPHCYKS